MVLPETMIAAGGIAASPIIWNIIARAEYRTHFLTKACGGNKYVGCYILAAWIFFSSLYRDHLFKVALDANGPDPFLQQYHDVLTPVAAVLFAVGGLFVLAAFYRLGITGTYLGDYFGILMDERVTAFPFSVLEHPMYDGATACFLAQALYASSGVGLALTVWVFVVYRVSTGVFEGPFTAKIYERRERELVDIYAKRAREECAKVSKKSN